MNKASLHRKLAVVAAVALAAAMTGVQAQDHAGHMHHDMANQEAHDHSAHMQHAMAAKAPGTVRIQLPDSALTDQNGKTAHFKSETVGNRLVLITFVYTTCTTVCPPLTALFADLQQRLGSRVGRDVSLITVTVDPLRDTPARLKAFGAQYGAKPGWSFLGGNKLAVDEVLTAFGVYTANFADHPAVVLAGDPRTGEWTRFFGFPGADQIMARVEQLQAARQDGAVASQQHHHEHH